MGPLPLLVLAFVILMAKSIVDKNFKKQPIGQKITYALLAGIFPVSSTRPQDKEDQRSDGVFVKGDKNSYSELTLLHFLHFLAYIAGATTYYILTETSPSFNDTMGKIKSSSGINSSWVVFVWCPITCLLSVLARIFFNQVEPWNIVQGPLDRSRCSC